MTTTTQTTPPADMPISGVFERWTTPGHHAIVLDGDAAAVTFAALDAIKTCTNLLAHRESELDDNHPTLCTVTTQGLLAAVACATEMLRLQLGGDACGVVCNLTGEVAQTIQKAAVVAAFKETTPGAAA